MQVSIEKELKAEAAAAAVLREHGDPRLAELERLASELHDSGVDFAIDQGRIVVPRGSLARDRETTIDFGKDHIRLGIVSDTHGGSKFEQLSALAAFYRLADEREVDGFVHAGDWTQGSDRMHRDQFLGIHAHGSDAQVNYVVATYPRSERGVKTYGIGGNHDDSFLADGGTNVVRQIAARRPDIEYVGQDAAYITLGGMRTYVQHPDGGGSYAKSYKPQKLSEALPNDRRVALHLIGHYHNWGLFRQQRTMVFMLPCFQSQYSWLARKGLNPDIGGLIVDLWLDDDGYAVRVVPELVSFTATQDDWDHEASTAVSHGWTPEGGSHAIG